ncbi:hypothetical protein FHG87_022360 [Trinorchestia longiramus]|nr:hypothetical protein FHG87_022360 [Trinorchestia longiramus]
MYSVLQYLEIAGSRSKNGTSCDFFCIKSTAVATHSSRSHSALSSQPSPTSPLQPVLSNQPSPTSPIELALSNQPSPTSPLQPPLPPTSIFCSYYLISVASADEEWERLCRRRDRNRRFKQLLNQRLELWSAERRTQLRQEKDKEEQQRLKEEEHRRQLNVLRQKQELGRLVSESACERKDPGSNPAADMVDAARNTAWDLGIQPNNYRSNYPTQEWVRSYPHMCRFRVAYSEHLTAAVARSRPAELRLRMEALRLQGLEKVLSERAERNLHFLVKKLNE